MTRESRPALVHDYLLVLRGAERTFLEMASCWPEAPIYTLLYDSAGTDGRFGGHPIRTSSLQWLPVRQRGFRRLLPLFPHAVERLPLSEHGLVVSSSSAFAHGVRPRAGAVHVCYCHSPFRYVWHERARGLAETRRPLRPLARRSLDRIRKWDLAATERVTHYIANSRLTQRRIEEFWGREASVVHPPVEVDRFSPGAPEDFFLVVTELVPHKRVDVALEAARRSRQPIKVVGDGPDLRRLTIEYGETAEFLGRVSDADLPKLYASARALVVPNIEEFGIAAVEGQASGRPVVGAAAGGLLETVIDGETGVLVPPGDVDALAEALRETDFDRFDSRRIVANAARFSSTAFRMRLRLEVERVSTTALTSGRPDRVSV